MVSLYSVWVLSQLGYLKFFEILKFTKECLYDKHFILTDKQFFNTLPTLARIEILNKTGKLFKNSP